MTISRREFWFPLVLIWALVFLGHLWEAQLKMDAMTYAAVAKHILSSGDWKTLHYTPASFPNFFQHPPLAIWLEALVFKLLGTSAATARLLPSFFALGTLVCVVQLGRQVGREVSLAATESVPNWTGFVAGLVLLGTFTFVKYASDFLLDGPLSFWLALGTLSFLRIASTRNALFATLVFGVSLAAAFMTKGVVAFSLPLATFLFAIISPAPRRWLTGWLLGLVVALLILSPWLFWGGGVAFVRSYLEQSVRGRIRSHHWTDHTLALMALVKTYWPWLPLWFFGVVRLAMLRPGIKLFRGAAGLCLIHSLIILGAFSSSGSFFEHYLVPFYPFAAPLVALAFVKWSEESWRKVVSLFTGTAIVCLVILATVPLKIRTQRMETIREAIPIVLAHCSRTEVREILISETVSEKWLGLATALWETPWEATSISATQRPSHNSQLLLTAAGISPGSGWEAVLEEAKYTLYQPKNANLCPPLGSQ